MHCHGYEIYSSLSKLLLYFETFTYVILYIEWTSEQRESKTPVFFKYVRKRKISTELWKITFTYVIFVPMSYIENVYKYDQIGGIPKLKVFIGIITEL